MSEVSAETCLLMKEELSFFPFLDRAVVRRGKSPVFTAAGAVALLFMTAMTAIGYHAWRPALIAALGIGPWLAGRFMAGKEGAS